jgi:hypothetical protein
MLTAARSISCIEANRDLFHPPASPAARPAVTSAVAAGPDRAKLEKA